jgi:hypothetical protein
VIKAYDQFVENDRGCANQRIRYLCWVFIPLLFSAWGAINLRNTWFFYDEWGVIGYEMTRSLRSGLIFNLNGHLWIENFLLYRIQVLGFGLQSHLFVELIFLISLLSLQLSLAWLLRTAKVPVAISLLLAGVVVYMPGAWTNSIFTVQIANASAFAFGLIAMAISVRFRSTCSRSLVAVMLVSSVVCDSGTATALLVMVATVVCLLEGFRYLWPTIPAAVILCWWYLTANLNPSSPGTLGHRVVVASQLLPRSLGAFLGIQVANQFLAGLVLLTLIAVGVGWAIKKDLLPPTDRSLLIAGLLGTAIFVLAIAQSRAGLIGANWTTWSRYLGQIDIPFSIAVTPALHRLAMHVADQLQLSRRISTVLACGIPVVLIAIVGFGVINLRSPIETPFIQENIDVHHDMESALVVINDGCPAKTRLSINAAPAASLSPQVEVWLLQLLIHQGKFHPDSGAQPDRAVTARICTQMTLPKTHAQT